jgi:hypothetical protein
MVLLEASGLLLYPVNMPDETQFAAESIMGTVGMGRFLAKKPRPISDAEVARASKFSSRIVSQVSRFLETARVSRASFERAAFDYFADKALLEVPKEILAPKIAVIVAPLPEGTAAALSALALSLFDHLATKLPRNAMPSLTGLEETEPSMMELSFYDRIWQTAHNPLVVLDDMNEGIAVTDEVDGLRLMFPEIHATTMASFIDQIADRKAEDDKWQIASHVKRRQLELFFGISPVSPEFASDLQALAAGVRMEKEQRSRLPIRPIEADADRLRTPPQRLAEK